MLHVKFTSKPFDKLTSQLAVVTTFSEERPLVGKAGLLDWRLNGRLSRLMMKHHYESQFKELLLMPAEGRIGSKAILICGLGAKADFSQEIMQEFTPFILETLNKKGVRDFIISFSDIVVDRFEWRNSVRLFVSHLYDYSKMERVRLCENRDHVMEAQKRHMDFGMNVEVSYEATAAA